MICAGRTIMLVFVFFVLAAVQPYAGTGVKTIILYKKNQLDSIQKLLDTQRKKIKILNTQEGVFLEQLDMIEKNIDISNTYILELSAAYDTTSALMELLQDSVKDLSVDLVKHQEKMKRRVREMYKMGKPSLFQIFFSSATVTDLVNRVYYMQQLGHYDINLLTAIKNTQQEIRKKSVDIEKKNEYITHLLLQKETEARLLQTQREERRELLKSVQTQKHVFENSIKELEKAEKELVALIGSIIKENTHEPQTTAFGNMEKHKGKLKFPVQGTMIEPFGKIVHPVYKTVTFNSGIDIKADVGAPVHAVFAGKVCHIGWMRGYGKIVLIDHGYGYITVYAHVDTILVSLHDVVTEGQNIATVGESGSINGAKLHFQIRNGTTTYDPKDWLE